MKKKLFAVLLCALILAATLLCVSAEAKKFTDVSANSWYTEAVNFCVDRGILSGTSDTTFEPHTGMTRSMFVTMLASYDGADLSGYTTSSFKDVRVGSWYNASIEWAYENKIVSGTGDGYFSPKATVTRQEIALMLYTYTAYKTGEPTAERSFKYNRYADKDDISSWAETATRWACGIGLFDAAGNEGDLPILCPKNTATRAQVALIMMNFSKLGEPEPTYTLTVSGNDISDYTIVHAEDAVEPVREAATLLAGWIEDAFGVAVPVTTDAGEPTDCEIIVGRTNREDMGLITVDRSNEYDLSYVIDVQGDRLVIAGQTDKDNRRGTLYGAYAFAEDALGFSFLMDNRIPIEKADREIADDYTLSGAPGFESRTVYWDTGWSKVYLNHDDYYKGTNWVHELGEWVGEELPCPTRADNVEKVIKKVKQRLGSVEKNNSGELTTVWVSQVDSPSWCRCEECNAVIREEGSRSGPLIRLCNKVCEALDAEGYNNYKILTLAYQYSVAPPEVCGVHKNVMIYYCTIENCFSCPFYNTECKLNKNIANNIKTWGELCEKFYIWDYSTSFWYSATAFPNFDVMHANTQWFYKNGARGIFSNAITSTSGEFGELRAYLLSRLYRDPMMTEDEYYAYMDEFMQMYYGSGWTYVREYLDLMEENSSTQHWSCNTPPPSIFDFTKIAEKADYINSLWDKAEAAADSAAILSDIQRSRLAATYIIQSAIYDDVMANGSDAEKEAYYTANEAFYHEFIKYGVHWTENDREINFSRAQPPCKW